MPRTIIDGEEWVSYEAPKRDVLTKDLEGLTAENLKAALDARNRIPLIRTTTNDAANKIK